MLERLLVALLLVLLKIIIIFLTIVFIDHNIIPLQPINQLINNSHQLVHRLLTLSELLILQSHMVHILTIQHNELPIIYVKGVLITISYHPIQNVD